MNSTDLQLVLEGCLRKDPRQQRTLYECFARPMLGICLRYSNDRMEAEDTLQLGFVKVFRGLESFKGGSFEGWMKKIFIRESINQYHSRNKNPLEFDDEFKYQNHQADGFTDAISQLNTEEIMKMVNKLPLGSKLVFNLYAIEGYGHGEIAEILGISEGTSKSQYSRARTILRKHLTFSTTTR